MAVDKELQSHLKRFAIAQGVPGKASCATHFVMREYTAYYGMNATAEQKMISIIARAHDCGITTYIHEMFSDKFALVFDIDGPPNQKELKDLLIPIYVSIRSIFDLQPEELYCVVFSACSDHKMSYHIHFPSIIVNRIIMKMVYDHIFNKSKNMRDFIDEQIISSQKLRMAFSDKWDKDRPAGRRLAYIGTYNCRIARIQPTWECDTHEILCKALVRRSDLEENTTLLNSVESLAAITMGPKLDMSPIDLIPHEDTNFVNLPPEYFSLHKMQIVIDYIKTKYQSDAKIMCTKIVTYMNNFVFMITDHPGKIIIIIRKYNAGKRKQKWTYVQKSQTDFLQQFQHIKVLVYLGEAGQKASCKSIGDVWMTHAEKRSHSTIIFDPRPDAHEKMEDDFNTYQGMYITLCECEKDVTDTGEDYKKLVEPILEHIREVWCADNPVVYTYVIKWLCHIILRPWIKTGVALVLVGSEGCGKSMIISAIGQLFGTHYLQVCDMDDLVGRFTSNLADKLFVFADEAFWGGCKSLSGKLKGMITEPQIRCEHKGFDTYFVDSYTNYILASNHWWAVPAGENARRWCCLGCTSKYNGDAEYFRRLNASLYDRNLLGLKAFVLYLNREIDLKSFIPSKFPMTSLLRSQKENSFDTLESWWDQVLHRGYVLKWQDYQTLDPTFEFEEKTPGLVKFFQGEKFGYQRIPLQRGFNEYQDEMRGTFGKIMNFQRFKQFLKDKNSFTVCKPPVKGHRETWVLINFKKCRNAWRKVYADPEMVFENEVAVDDDEPQH